MIGGVDLRDTSFGDFELPELASAMDGMACGSVCDDSDHGFITDDDDAASWPILMVPRGDEVSKERRSEDEGLSLRAAIKALIAMDGFLLFDEEARNLRQVRALEAGVDAPEWP